MEEILQLLRKEAFPRSAKYNPEWMLDNQMGPNALWLMEWLTEAIILKPGMRVLDLGCGRAVSSIFLAKEFGVTVWAVDWWISQDNNWRRVIEAGVEDKVFPVRTEAHALPFPTGFFDAVVSVDAYHYFGTDTMYIEYISRFIKPSGILAVVVPGLTQPFENTVPEHLSKPQSNGKVFWEDECACFKTADWWHDHWKNSSHITEVNADTQHDGWRHWYDFEKAIELAGKGVFPSDAEALEKDAGRYIGFVRATAKRTGSKTMNLYDPSIAAQMGADR